MNLTAAVVRDWATEHNIPVGQRGRVSHETLIAFLQANPHPARELAAQVGITVGQRGRIGKQTAEQIVAKV